MYQALLEPNNQSPQGFGLRLILNDIGDPKKTLKDKLLWLKNDTMISRAPSGPGYKVWVFNCRKAGRDAHIANRGSYRGTPQYEVWEIFSYEREDRNKLMNVWKQGAGKYVNTHLVGGALKNVHGDYWRQSKTGEVNVTGFRPKKKLALAALL